MDNKDSPSEKTGDEEGGLYKYSFFPQVPERELRLSLMPIIHRCPFSDEHVIKNMLFEKFGDCCWGCGCGPPKNAIHAPIGYLQLDHIRPKSEYEDNGLSNRALLCPPCNGKKSDKLTLRELRRQIHGNNLKKVEAHLVDLKEAGKWAKEQEAQARCRLLAEYLEAQSTNPTPERRPP